MTTCKTVVEVAAFDRDGDAFAVKTLAVGGARDAGELVTEKEGCAARKKLLINRQLSEGSEIVILR
jgi:hypothetical protein